MISKLNKKKKKKKNQENNHKILNRKKAFLPHKRLSSRNVRMCQAADKYRSSECKLTFALRDVIASHVSKRHKFVRVLLTKCVPGKHTGVHTGWITARKPAHHLENNRETFVTGWVNRWMEIEVDRNRNGPFLISVTIDRTMSREDC